MIERVVVAVAMIGVAGVAVVALDSGTWLACVGCSSGGRGERE